MKKITILLIIILLTSGCSYEEINKLAIISAVGIDYENDMYHVSAQVMDLQKETNDTTNESSILYEATGKTILEALTNISLKYPNTIYLGHLELLIIGKDVLDEGIDKTFDYFLRNPQARTDCLLLISTKNKAIDIINPKNENNQGTFPSKDLITTIENSQQLNGYIVKETMEEFIRTYINEGIDPVVTNIAMTKGKDIKTELTGIAAFKKNKYIKDLNKEQAIAYNTLNGNYYEIIINVPYKDNLANISIIEPSSKIKIDINNDQIKVNIDVKLDGHIIEIHSDSNFMTEKDFEIMEIEAENILNKYIENLTSFCLENDTDILGLKNNIYKYHYKEYKKYKNKNIYEIANINISSDINIFRYGNIYKEIGGNNE